MTNRNFVLGSVAAIALSGVMFAAPSFAQTAQPTQPNSQQDGGLYGSQVNSPQYSTPAEKQETKQLNDKAEQGTNASPAVLNGEAPATNNAVQTQQNDPNMQGAPPATGPQSSNAPLMKLAQNDSQQQYQDQQQQYQQQQQDYQDKKAQYDEQKHVYDRRVREYDQARWEYTDYPRVYAYRYDDSPDLRRLYLIAEPSQQLANVPIESRNGMWVGRVRNVETAPDGRPARIEVSLNHRVSVWVNPGDFRYDPEEHVLFTDLTRDDLWDMPGATVESSGPY